MTTRPVPIVDLTAVTSEMVDQLPYPLLVRGFSAPARALPRKELEAILGGMTLWIYDPDGSYRELGAGEFLGAFSAPDADPGLNVVDVYLEGERFDAAFPVPRVFDEVNLLPLSSATARYRRSVVLSARSAFTGLHVDANGFSGWMYLVAGLKRWELMAPETGAHLRTNGGYQDPGAHAPLPDDVESWVTIVRPGEMIMCPPGWIHRVATLETSVGFGGALLSAGMASRALAAWRKDVADGAAGPLPLHETLRGISLRGAVAAQARTMLEAALDADAQSSERALSG